MVYLKTRKNITIEVPWGRNCQQVTGGASWLLEGWVVDDTTLSPTIPDSSFDENEAARLALKWRDAHYTVEEVHEAEPVEGEAPAEAVTS